MNETEGSAGRDDGGESGVWDAEDSCSVTAAPFSRPVRPVFVTSDVSIKTRATIRNHPLPSRRPGCHHDPRAPPGSAPPFTRDPAPDSFCLSPPPSDTHTHQRALLSLGVTLLIQEWKKKEQYRPKVKKLCIRFHGFSMFVNIFDAI